VSAIEVIICLLLLFMAVPDVCARLGRPALGYPVFVVFGALMGPLADAQVHTMMNQAGKVGFLLLLFEVGLEIELPRLREVLRPLRIAVLWALIQYPVIIGSATLVGFSPREAILAATALTGCSVGMAHAAWKHYPAIEAESRGLILNVMVLLETFSIILLSVESVALSEGVGWRILFKLISIVLLIVLIGRVANPLGKLFQTILERTLHWRTHLLVLVILAICALGERAGLPGAKTAFFLGLFMSGIRHDGVGLHDYLAPISKRFLIPILFVSLGLQLKGSVMFTLTGALALATAAILLGLREILHMGWLRIGADKRVFLLLCPNLPIVALAAGTLLEKGAHERLATWLLLTGLFTTLAALFSLPRTRIDATDDTTQFTRAGPV